jgi:hypothetical protein
MIDQLRTTKYAASRPDVGTLLDAMGDDPMIVRLRQKEVADCEALLGDDLGDLR